MRTKEPRTWCKAASFASRKNSIAIVRSSPVIRDTPYLLADYLCEVWEKLGILDYSGFSGTNYKLQEIGPVVARSAGPTPPPMCHLRRHCRITVALPTLFASASEMWPGHYNACMPNRHHIELIESTLCDKHCFLPGLRVHWNLPVVTLCI